MAMLNRTIIMGRLTRDPELRRTQSGIAVATFSIAVERDFKDKQSGEKVTDFFDVVAWRNSAEFVSRYFSKGRMAVVEGRLQNRDWQDRDGNKRRTTEIIADNVYFGDSKKDGDGGGDYQSGYPQGSYSGRYGGGYSPPLSRRSGSPAGGYPPSNYSGGDFTELGDDDDGELPF